MSTPYKPQWVMTVVVISTLHMPGPNPVVPETLVFREYDGGLMVYIEDLLPCETQEGGEWLLEVAKALPGCKWVRFDIDADEVPGLKTYPEMWV